MDVVTTIVKVPLWHYKGYFPGPIMVVFCSHYMWVLLLIGFSYGSLHSNVWYCECYPLGRRLLGEFQLNSSRSCLQQWSPTFKLWEETKGNCNSLCVFFWKSFGFYWWTTSRDISMPHTRVFARQSMALGESSIIPCDIIPFKLYLSVWLSFMYLCVCIHKYYMYLEAYKNMFCFGFFKQP